MPNNDVRGRKRPSSCRFRLEVEQLESRLVPYSVSGNAWPTPGLVTISFMADGTLIDSGSTDYYYSNLYASLNARFGSPGVWQREILRAAQVWAQQTNLNFSVIFDNGTPIGQGAYQQGDPNMGDIRIGGYVFEDNNMAWGYLPPPGNTFSEAGDIGFNTIYPWSVGGAADLFTVAAHEFGHALGLHHGVGGSVMQDFYTGVKTALHSDDIAGIQAIYGGTRADDNNDAGAAHNDTVANAINLTPYLNPTTQAVVVSNKDITTYYDIDFFKVTAPTGTSGTFTITFKSTGFSLFTGRLKVFDANLNTLADVSAPTGSLNGTDLTVTLNNVNAGQLFYLKFTGTDSSAFSTGRYVYSVNFGSGPSPVASPYNTQLAVGSESSPPEYLMAAVAGQTGLTLGASGILAGSQVILENGRLDFGELSLAATPSGALFTPPTPRVVSPWDTRLWAKRDAIWKGVTSEDSAYTPDHEEDGEDEPSQPQTEVIDAVFAEGI